MYLSASDICYLHDGNDALLFRSELTNRRLATVSRETTQGDCPHIQVAERSGHWFALNNSQLDLCRMLEREGKCDKIQAEVVDPKQVPEHVRQMMIAPKPVEGDKKGKGYLRLDQNEATTVEMTSDVSSEEETDNELGDWSSECDWSDCLDSSEDDSEDDEDDGDTHDGCSADKDTQHNDEPTSTDEEHTSLL